MKKRVGSERNFNVFLILVIAASFLLFFFNNFPMTGYATEGTTTSNVSIQKYLAIAFGSNLSSGIYFGNVATLPATDINATHNNDSSTYPSGTTYTIDVSTDSNTHIDFCIRANAGLTSPALDVIGLANETYSSSNLTNSTHPMLSNQSSITTSYVKAPSTDILPGNSSYWRFWLDVPAAQPSGDYNNTVSFKGVVNGLSC